MVIWQDIALTIIGFMFAVFLIPMLRNSLRGYSVSKLSAATTSIGLYTTCVIYSSLGLWLATLSAFVSGTMWLLLLWSAERNEWKCKVCEHHIDNACWNWECEGFSDWKRKENGTN